jgi:mono/diheme cytochrome c family protein
MCSGAINGTCVPNPTDVKTTTHPALTSIKLADGTATTVVLDKLYSDVMSARMPHLPTDIGFVAGQFGYLTASGADAVFRMDIKDGVIESVGSATNDFINLRKDTNDKLIRLPIGIATANTQAFGFVINDGSRDVTALSFNTQAIAGDPAAMDFRIVESSKLPAADTPEDFVLKGKRFFSTGLGRWSLNGEAWGSCAACHIDGLSDNITWYFARGPRQSVSLDGSFSTKDPADQRIFNWTAIVDEIADFEGNTRGISGGKGAIVDANDARINTAAESPPQQGLQGSSKDVADPMGTSMHPHSVLNDWNEIEAWVKTIRSPRKPTNLIQADVDAGKALFSGAGQANCVGCHSGSKWTISTLFYTPGDTPNAATASMAADSLSSQSWNVMLNGFPQALFPVNSPPADLMTQARMRFGAPPGAEQLQCALRPVGTFGVSPMAVAVLELRQDMTTTAQGNADTGRGYNVPSLLGMQVGAPYFHAGNARTLEEVFDDNLFKAHHSSAIAQVFLMDATKAKQLVAYVLSIDENEPELQIPAKGATGGILCSYTP